MLRLAHCRQPGMFGLQVLQPEASTSVRNLHYLASSPASFRSRKTEKPNYLPLLQATARRRRVHTDVHFADIGIVGGGVVGLALASSLAASNAFKSSSASIRLIEGSSLDKAREWSRTKQNGSEGAISDWDNRVIYLTEENRQWLDDIGVTPYLLTSRLGPVHRMHVTDGVSAAALDFDTPDSSSRRLGTMVEISNLQQALLHRITDLGASKNRVQILDSSRVETIDADGEGEEGPALDAWPVLHHSVHKTPLKTRLLVGADGNNSPVRKYAGIKATGWEYGRMGLVATMKIRADVLDERTAYQRFLPTGTIAWLPLSSEAASLVWTLPPHFAKALIAMHKGTAETKEKSTVPLAQLITAAFRLPWPILEKMLKKIAAQECFGAEDGNWLAEMIEEELRYSSAGTPLPEQAPAPVIHIDEKSVAAFPLKLSHAECYLGSSRLKSSISDSGAGAFRLSTLLERAISISQEVPIEEERVRGRTALIGDAAHTVHPLAGQGLNLGLADARSLSKALSQALERGEDLGSHLSLSAYPRERYLVNQAMLSAVDHLHWLFLTPPPGDARNGFFGDLWSNAVVWSRSTGLEVLNELSSVKRALIGFAGSRK